MSNDIAIRVENLSKAYRIGLKEQRHETMLGALAAWVKSPLRNFREVRSLSSFGDIRNQGPGTADHRPQTTDLGPGKQKSVVSGQLSVVSPEVSLSGAPQVSGFIPLPSSTPSDIIWALKDVSFEVKHGEVVGIIGRNSAGKSTLLKILSRITEPTHGRATVYGRVGSLLEVGTGFHPDLTGRENVYLNGTILGMKKREVDARFDEIVDFSGVEKFIDTPVKRYSSGMRVRLAFAVAAHLEPEILIVDEVLAVGDAEFQKKCLGKMKDVAGRGRTVLFVSHNMAAVVNLCSTALRLSKGGIHACGTPEKVINDYLQVSASAEALPLAERSDRKGSGRLRFTAFDILGETGDTTDAIKCGQNITFRLCYQTDDHRPAPNVAFSIGIYSVLGHFLLFLENEMVGIPFKMVPHVGEVICEVPRLPLAPGRYDVNINATVNEVLADWVRGVRQLEVVGGDFFGSGRLPPQTHGGFLTAQRWQSIN